MTSEAQWTSVGVGSIPDGIYTEEQLDLLSSRTSTLLERVASEQSADAPPPMVRVWNELTEGEVPKALISADGAPRKAQLVGPITLLTGNFATLAQTFRSTRRALDTLLENYPSIEEIWLDEPMLDRSKRDHIHMLEKCMRALKAEFFDLKVGVHVCNHAPFEQLIASEALDVLHVDSASYGDELTQAVASLDLVDIEVVLGALPAHADDAEIADHVSDTCRQASALRAAGATVRRVSTSCGLGTLSPESAVVRMQQLESLTKELNKLGGEA